MTGTPSHRIFISYGHKDAVELARRLRDDLEKLGHRVWLDESGMRAGPAWEEQIEREILGCDVFLALLSPHAVRRPDGVCLDEISLARYHGSCRLVPVMVLLCRPPLGIYRLQWVDFQNWRTPDNYEKAFARLCQALEEDPVAEGLYARLFGFLTPLDFGADLARLSRHFTGREWLFAALENWLADQSSRVFFLTGDPGAGKSAALARLVEKDPRVGAYHFCQYTLSDSRNPRRFVMSVAAQLATQFPDYRAALEAVNLEGLQGEETSTLLRRLVADPLRVVQPEGPVLLIVDALDEAHTGQAESIPRLLAARLEDLPPWVRLVLSSRKEPELLDLFSRYRPFELAADRPENLADIRRYLEARLAAPELVHRLEAQRVAPAAVAKVIEERGEGNFLYVTQVVADIRSGQLDPAAPNAFPRGLVGLYLNFFQRVFPDRQVYRQFRPLLEVLLAAREPLSAQAAGAALGRDPFEVEQDLEQVAVFFPRREGKYAVYHKSLGDWLIGRAGESMAYRVNLAAGHRTLADLCLAHWREGQLDPYGLAHLPVHLKESGREEELRALLLDYRWLQDKLAAWGVQALIQDYDLLPGDRHLQLVQGALRLAAHVLARDLEQLASQLLGRLLGFESPVIKDFCSQTTARKNQEGKPWLRPLTPTLTPPGGPLRRTLSGHTGSVTAVALSPDGRQAVSASRDSTLKVWDLETGREILTLSGHTEGVRAVALSPDGRQAVSGSWDKTLKVWDLETGREILTLSGHTWFVKAVALSADGRQAVSASNDGTLKVWDLATGRESLTLSGHTEPVMAVALSPDGRQAVSASEDRTLKVWDLATGRERLTLTGRTGPFTAVALSPDGRQAVSGSWDRTLKVWDLAAGRASLTLGGHTGSVEAVALSPDGRQIVSGSEDSTLKVWDLATGREILTLSGHTKSVTAVALSPDGRQAVSASWDHTLKVWDLKTGRESLTLSGHTEPVMAVALSPDSRQAVSASLDRTLKVWDLATGREIITLSGHTAPVIAVALSPDGRQAVSGSGDGSLKVWDLTTGAELASFRAEAGIRACAVVPPGGSVAAGDFSGRVHFLRLENIIPGPPVITVWRWQDTLALGCPHCRRWSKIPKAALGTALPCPRCGQPLKVNSFVIKADWRPVAKAWAAQDQEELVSP